VPSGACRTRIVDPALPRVYGKLLPLVRTPLPLLSRSMFQRLPKVGEWILQGGPVEKNLEASGIYQCLGVRSIKSVCGAQVCPALGILDGFKPL
jgi:hypothetical protein